MTSQDEKLGRLTERLESAHDRIDTLEVEMQDYRKLIKAMARVDEKVDNIKEDMDEVKIAMREVVSRPSRWWDKLVIAVISTLSSGVAAAILALILK